MTTRKAIVVLGVMVLLFAHGQDARATARELKYAVKTKRTLWSDGEIATARENVKKYSAAKKVADEVITAADYWVGWSDEELVRLVTDSTVPRAFETGTGGCPKCGHLMYEKFGQYGWVIDPKVPMVVKCPVDGTTYPNEQMPDDGWGWKNPKDGEKYWFVAYWNHWMWHKHLALGVRSLGRAYLLTGDQKYAHKAVVILHRIAEVYPGMDHAKQSRYGQMMAERGIDYPGKVVNAIWECGLAENVTEAYDDVWETIDSDVSAQKLFGKSGEGIRKFIEANFLEDAIDAVFSAKIRGNFGMHQNTLVYLGIVRQFGETDKWFDELLNRNSSSPAVLGLNYALYNLISRDGFPDENSPGYDFIWVSKIAEYGDLLSRMGRDVFANPRTKRMFDAVLDQVVVGKKTPAIGDSSSVWGGITGQNAEVYQTAWRHYGDPRYAKWLERMGAAGEKGFTGFESLMFPVVSAPGDTPSPRPSPGGRGSSAQKSRLMDGYGEAILNNPGDTVGVSMFYGLKGGHGHFDRLNLDVFGEGEALMPDLGYPDAMNDFVKGIYSWSKNTISHNTVTVDARRQVGNVPGEVKLFADGKWARVVDVDATGTYPQCSRYRRAVVMVDCGEGRSYFVDFFTVEGGKQHDYSLHGPVGKLEMVGGKWGAAQTQGTLAGKDVGLGVLYDAPEMEGKDYKGGYGRYAGSGFEHLFNVRRLEGGAREWAAQYEHARNAKSHVRIRVLDQAGQEVMWCEARVSPVKNPEILNYIIARKAGDGVKSRFVSVIEPFGEKEFIKSVKEVEGKVMVEREGGERDQIEYDAAKSAVKVTRGTRVFSAGPGGSGSVEGVDVENGTVLVKMKETENLIGRVVHFSNSLHRTAHPVVKSEGMKLTVGDDLVVGKARVDSVAGDALVTHTAMPFAGSYAGAWVCTADYQGWRRIKAVSGGKIQLEEKLADGHPLMKAKDVWIVDVGPGDRIECAKIEAEEGR
jgi:hypothetical protein